MTPPERTRLEALGWEPGFERAFAALAEPGWRPARVALSYGGLHRILTEETDLLADVSGRLRHAAGSAAGLPAVGDWVAAAPRPAEGRATIHAVLPRRSRFARKAAGDATTEQVVAANVDTVFLVSGLDRDFNLRRIERYLSLAKTSGARPVLVLNKADLEADPASLGARVESIAAGAPVHLVSARTGTGIGELLAYAVPGQTVALLGSSGVGKSSLVNRLLGEDRQTTREVRVSDQRGRHATVHRELLELPGGGILIDTPGLREIQLWDAAEGLGDAFEDVSSLAEGCRFRDCRHEGEPGCAVLDAAAEGRLSEERLASYRKLSRELEVLATRQDGLARRAERRRWASLARLGRRHRPRG